MTNETTVERIADAGRAGELATMSSAIAHESQRLGRQLTQDELNRLTERVRDERDRAALRMLEAGETAVGATVAEVVDVMIEDASNGMALPAEQYVAAIERIVAERPTYRGTTRDLPRRYAPDPGEWRLVPADRLERARQAMADDESGDPIVEAAILNAPTVEVAPALGDPCVNAWPDMELRMLIECRHVEAQHDDDGCRACECPSYRSDGADE